MISLASNFKLYNQQLNQNKGEGEIEIGRERD